MRLPEAYRGLPRPSSASEPSYPPDGVAYRAYLKAQYPIGVRSNLYTAIIVSSISLRPSSEIQWFSDCIGYEMVHSLSIVPWLAFKGGDPAAGSPTATLLRLLPPHRA